MVRKTTLKTKIFSSLIFSTFLTFLNVVTTYATCTIVDGHTQCEEGANFQVNIPEVLTIQITSPNSWAIGEAGTFLKNEIVLSVTSNNAAGFHASMTTNATNAEGSALTNINSGSNDTIPMLTANWTRSNTTNTKFWGYSTDDGSDTGTYKAVALKGATMPTRLIDSDVPGNVLEEIYFGAKADSTVASGTYKGTVIISAVSGAITKDNPETPVDPAKPEDTDPVNPSYDGDKDHTTHTDIAFNNNSTNTSTIEVSEGDTRDYYTEPKGVSTATINEGTPLATGLAVTAVVAATAGICFFIIARRREEEDDDEY